MSKLKNSRAVCSVQGWGLPLDMLGPGLGHRNEPTFMEDGGVVRVVVVVV